MGQIVGLKAKPKRCNLNKLSQLGIPAAGEYILVSYDNSMTANGQGNFDRYIMGDGRTAATALELKYLDDSTRPYIVEEVNKAVADIQPIEITGDVTNAPDEEDLTSENQGGTDVLKFKDKAYNSALYSGLGRVYLRKNIVTLEGVGKNVLTQAMVNTANTIYHIQYDYDLNGQTITLPAGCVLEFDGGSVKNGTIISNILSIYNGNFDAVTIVAGNELNVFNSKFAGATTQQKFIDATDAKVIVENSTFESLGNSSGMNNVSAIVLKGDCSLSKFINLLIRNIYAETNSTGIQFSIYEGKVSENFTIENCDFYNIIGASDDGDGIKVIYGVNGYEYDINSIISNCYFENCSKRAIKIQSLGVKVLNCTIIGGCVFSAIDFQQGDCYIDNVKIKSSSYVHIFSSARKNVVIRNVFIETDDNYVLTYVHRMIELNGISDNGNTYDSTITIENVSLPNIGTNSSSFYIKLDRNVSYGNLYLNNIELRDSVAGQYFLYLWTNIASIHINNIIALGGYVRSFSGINSGDTIYFNSLTLENLSNIAIPTELPLYRERVEFVSTKDCITGDYLILRGGHLTIITSRIRKNNLFYNSKIGDISVVNGIIYTCVKNGNGSSDIGEWHSAASLDGILGVNNSLVASNLSKGTTSQRPNYSDFSYNGRKYFDTTIFKQLFAKIENNTSVITSGTLNNGDTTLLPNTLTDGVTYMLKKSKPAGISIGYANENGKVVMTLLDTSSVTEFLLVGNSSYPYIICVCRTDGVIVDIYNGLTEWVEEDGEEAGIARSGPFSSAPTPYKVGFVYFNTDTNKPMYWGGSAYYYADGTIATA